MARAIGGAISLRQFEYSRAHSESLLSTQQNQFRITLNEGFGNPYSKDFRKLSSESVDAA
jgi:hypothetical protein